MSTETFGLKEVMTVIEHYEMLKNCDGVVAAVSGGCDSSVLLDVLSKLSGKMGFKLVCAHINHNLRGAESDRDEEFVRSLCKKYGIEIKVLSANVAEYADEHRLSTEEAGRKLRYEFFEHCANELSENARIATAHSLSDCAETFIFNAARGSSLSGICGIPPVRGKIIRPLIEFSREQIENYANEHEISYVTDSTNLTDEYTRNKIRHEVIPVMKEINPGFEKAFLRLLKNLSAVRDYIDIGAKELLENSKNESGFDGSLLKNAPDPIKNKAAAMILEEFGFALDSERTLRLAENFGKNDFKEELCADEYLVQKDGIIRKEIKPKESPKIIETAFAEGKIEISSEKTAEILIMPYEKFKNSYKINNYVLKDTFDFDKIQGITVIRSRKTGDKANIHGGTKTLKKLFIEEKIPAAERSSIAVVSDEEGVLWVEGLGAERRARLSEKTVRVAVLKIHRKINEF